MKMANVVFSVNENNIKYYYIIIEVCLGKIRFQRAFVVNVMNKPSQSRTGKKRKIELHNRFC